MQLTFMHQLTRVNLSAGHCAGFIATQQEFVTNLLQKSSSAGGCDCCPRHPHCCTFLRRKDERFAQGQKARQATTVPKLEPKDSAYCWIPPSGRLVLYAHWTKASSQRLPHSSWRHIRRSRRSRSPAVGTVHTLQICLCIRNVFASCRTQQRKLKIQEGSHSRESRVVWKITSTEVHWTIIGLFFFLRYPYCVTS